MLTRQEIQDAGKAVLLEVLRESEHRNYYICPECGEAKVYKPRGGLWRCLKCGAHGDAFNALQRQGMTAREAFDWVMQRMGKRVSSGSRSATPAEDRRPRVKREPMTAAAEPDLSAWRAGCADYCREAAAALPGSPGEQYLLGRGITVETMRRNLVGYDARAKVGGSMAPYGRESVILPYDSECSYYSARFLTPYKDKAGNLRRFARPPAEKAGCQPVFHAKQLWLSEADAVFIVESEIDALSVSQAARLLKCRVGAVACGGGNNTEALVKALSGRPSRARLLVAFDNDKSGCGWADAERLSEKLTRIGQRHGLVIPWRAYGGANDINDILRDCETGGLAEVLDVIMSDEDMLVTGDALRERGDALRAEMRECMI